MNKIVTISREFGSGGREIGKRLADHLGFAYYDQEIITELAKKVGASEEYIENIGEKGIYPYPIQYGRTFSMNFQHNQTDVFIAQTKIIKELAQKGDAIMVGRGADSILEEYEPMKLFIYANMDYKMERCREKSKENLELTQHDLKKKIQQVDKNRKKYYELISNLEWGQKENYHLCLNTSGIEIKTMIPALAEYIEKWFRRKNQ